MLRARFSNLCGITEFIVNKSLHLPPYKNEYNLAVLVIK